MEQGYSFVVDANNRPLAPTKINRAWYLIRKGKAWLKSKYPMVIQLNRIVDTDDTGIFVCGIDDGSKHVGISIVQKCKNRNKVVFKGVMEQRKDVKHLMDVRRGYRRYHRYHKRYRPKRFSNRRKPKGWIPPSIKQKKDAILRVLRWLNKWVPISEYHLEDVKMDIRALTDGYKPYKWEYQDSNRLDENLRRAVLLRDNGICGLCGKRKAQKEVHHIHPRSKGGANTISNLITLCNDCHKTIKGKESDYEDMFYNLTGRKAPVLREAMHVMQGKTYLRERIEELGTLYLTTGGDTANKRLDWGIEKSHSNDAVCITGLRPDTVDISEWIMKPMRRKSKAKTEQVLGIRHHDYVEYTYRNGETYRGYVRALYPKLNTLSFQSQTKRCDKVNARKCKVLWKFNKIYWFKCVS